MHDKLYDAAVERGRLWTAMAAIGVVSGHAIWWGIHLGTRAGIVALVVMAPLAFWLLSRRSGFNVSRSRPKKPLLPPDDKLSNIASGLSVATGARPAVIGWVDDPVPNVGGLPEPSGAVIVVSAGAMRVCTKDEVEALAGAQLAIVNDKGASQLFSAFASTGSLRVVGIVLFFPSAFIGLAEVTWPWLITSAAAWLFHSRIAWWASVTADAVSIRTTRNPEALARAYEKLAAYNGKRFSVKSWGSQFGSADAYYAAPVSAHWSSSVERSGKDYATVKTSEMESDLKLLVRAEAIKRLSQGQADLEQWTTIRQQLSEGTRSVSTGGHASVGVHRVGLTGVVSDDAPTATEEPPSKELAMPEGSDQWTYPDAVRAAKQHQGQVDPASLHRYGSALLVVVKTAPLQDQGYWQGVLDATKASLATLSGSTPAMPNLLTVAMQHGRVKRSLKEQYDIDW